jgi:hypothetical protein
VRDDELLELAAKAAGIKTHGPASVAGLMVQLPSEGIAQVFGVWNPLTNEGEALRLAVKLGMYVECNRGDTEVRCALNDGNFYITQRFDGDALTATCRAIVRVAAEVGRTK